MGKDGAFAVLAASRRPLLIDAFDPSMTASNTRHARLVSFMSAVDVFRFWGVCERAVFFASLLEVMSYVAWGHAKRPSAPKPLCDLLE